MPSIEKVYKTVKNAKMESKKDRPIVPPVGRFERISGKVIEREPHTNDNKIKYNAITIRTKGLLFIDNVLASVFYFKHDNNDN